MFIGSPEKLRYLKKSTEDQFLVEELYELMPDLRGRVAGSGPLRPIGPLATPEPALDVNGLDATRGSEHGGPSCPQHCDWSEISLYLTIYLYILTTGCAGATFTQTRGHPVNQGCPFYQGHPLQLIVDLFGGRSSGNLLLTDPQSAFPLPLLQTSINESNNQSINQSTNPSIILIFFITIILILQSCLRQLSTACFSCSHLQLRNQGYFHIQTLAYIDKSYIYPTYIFISKVGR